MTRERKRTQRPAIPADAADHLRQVPTPAAADLLGLTPRTLEKMRLHGGGPRFVRVSATCVRYRLTDLAAWQESRLRSNTTA